MDDLEYKRDLITMAGLVASRVHLKHQLNIDIQREKLEIELLECEIFELDYKMGITENQMDFKSFENEQSHIVLSIEQCKLNISQHKCYQVEQVGLIEVDIEELSLKLQQGIKC